MTSSITNNLVSETDHRILLWYTLRHKWWLLVTTYFGSLGICSERFVSRTAMVKPMSLAGLWKRSVNSVKSTFPSWLASTHIMMYSISSLIIEKTHITSHWTQFLHYFQTHIISHYDVFSLYAEYVKITYHNLSPNNRLHKTIFPLITDIEICDLIFTKNISV